MERMEEMKPNELCELCAGDVAPEEAYRAELTVGETMCPTPMVFHPACYEKAAHLWQADEGSYCTTDPEFPETQQWTPAEAPRA